jgi:hypothetical protein
VPARTFLVLLLTLGLLFGKPATSVRAGQDICSEPNDAPDQACGLGGNSSAAGYIESPDDVDRYRIQVGEGQTVQASLSTLPGDYNFRLEGEDGTSFAQGEGSGSDDKALGTGALSAGTYLLVVYSESGESSADSAYTLRVSVQGRVAVTLNVDPNAPTFVSTADRPIEQLVLIGEFEAGEKTKQSDTKHGKEGDTPWYEVTFKRDAALSKLGPLLIVDRVYKAADVGTAQQIYNAQTGAGLPEAKALGLNYTNLGPVPLPAPLGDQAQMLGACANKDCTANRGESPTRHYRTVFRMGSLVHTVYSWGPDNGNNVDVAFDVAKRIEKRVNTPPEGPPPEIVSNRPPEQIGIHIDELGKQINEIFSRTGSDGRSRWYEARFERDQETISQRLGATIVYNKVFVANSNADARDIFQESSVDDFPEATEKRGPTFPEPKTKPVGNDWYSVGACNDDCNGAQSQYLHERIVLRWGNVVAIIYTWGREDQSNPDYIGDRARILFQRIP